LPASRVIFFYRVSHAARCFFALLFGFTGCYTGYHRAGRARHLASCALVSSHVQKQIRQDLESLHGKGAALAAVLAEIQSVPCMVFQNQTAYAFMEHLGASSISRFFILVRIGCWVFYCRRITFCVIGFPIRRK
jgi:hypothetical protein